MARTEVTGLQIKDGSVSLTADVTGILPVANGGTGSDTLALNNVLLGNGTGALQAVAPGASGNVLTSNGTSWTSAPAGAGEVTLAGTQTLTNKTLTTPTITTPTVKDATGANFLTFSPATTPVNHLMVGNREAGNAPSISAVGTDTNIDLSLVPKGTGRVRIQNGLQSGGAGGTLILPTTADTLVGRATTDTLTNKTISGASNTITNLPASATPDASRKVREHGTSANNWYKIVTYSPGAVAYARLNVVLVISSFNTTGAIISVTMGNNAADTNPTGAVEFLSKGNIFVLADNAFKIVADGYGQPIELWVQTVNTNGSALTYYESSRYSNSSGVVYDTSNTAVTTEPVGTVLNARSAGVVVNGEPVVTTTGTQTLTNKTLTSPKFTSTLLGSNSGTVLSFSDGGVGNNYIKVVNRGVGFPPYFQPEGSDTNIGLNLVGKGTGSVTVGDVPIVTTTGTQTLTNKTLTSPQIATINSTNNAPGFGISAPAGSVNYLNAYGNPAASPVYLAAVGSDTNIAMYLQAKGTAAVNIGNTGGQSTVQVIGAASTANFLQIFGAAAGNPPAISAVGSDTNVSLSLASKGTGTVNANGVPVVTTTGAQTLTNKTLTSPTITGTPVANFAVTRQVVGKGKFLPGTVVDPSPIGQGDGSISIGLHNDLAHLIERGGTGTITQNGTSIDASGLSALFKGSGLNISATAITDVFVIEVTKPATHPYGAFWQVFQTGINFRTGFVAQSVKIEHRVDGVWTTSYDVTGDTEGVHYVKAGAAPPYVDAFRFTLTDFQGAGANLCRIQNIWSIGTTANPAFSSAAINFLPRSGGDLFGTAASPPLLQAAGGEANIPLNLYSKGTGAVVLRGTNGISLLANTAAASSVNYVQATGNVTGSRPYLQAGGSDTNIDLDLFGKGTGVVRAAGIPVVTTTATQTLTNKTLTSPAITTPTGIVKGDVGLGNVDNTTDENKPVSTATQTALNAKENTSNKGIANGYASLDSGGKVPVAQLPNSIMEYQGTWNASTNTPTLANGTGSAGDVYRVSVAGTSLSLTFEVGDYVIYNGSTWEKSDTTDAVVSVAGKTGNVTLTSTDVGLANVDNTSNATERAATATLTNKTLTSPRINQINDTTSGLPAIVPTAAASSVNYVEIRGTLTGQQPQVRAQGTDTNIDILLVGKGTGSAAVYAFTGNDAKLSVTAADANANLNLIPKGTGVVQASGVPVVTTTGAQTLTSKTLSQPAIVDSLGNNVVGIIQRANAVNYLQFRGTEATGSPAIFAVGADTDVGFTFVPKGAGAFQIYEPVGQGIATIQSAGAGANIDLDLVSKGSGVVEANGIPVVTTTLAQTLTNKTLTSPAITSPTGITKADVGLGNVDNTSTTTISQSLRANRNLNGGGTFTVDASGYVLWSNRIMVISNGRGSNFTTDGYFGIFCPTSGTITGVGGAANKTATAAGIPLAAFEALYYILPIGSANTTVNANFRVASYTANLDIPHDWVLICVRSDSNVFTFNNGITLRPGESLNCITQDTASTVNTLVRRDASGNFSAGTITAALTGNATSATTANTATTATYVTTGTADNANSTVNFRVMRNSNTTTLNDGMYIGYGNSNSGITRIYGGGNTTNAVEVSGGGALAAPGGVTVGGVAVPTISSISTLTNKTLALGSNTVSGTLAEFNTAVTDADLARTDAANTFTGVQTMTSPALTTPVITGTPTGTGVATAATVSTLALRDANANLTADNFISAVESTVAAGGTTALTIASPAIQVFTSNGSHTLRLPTTDITAGMQYRVINQQSTGSVAVQSSAAALIATVPAGFVGDYIALVNTPTTAAHWRGLVYATTGQIVSASNSLAAFATSTTNAIGVGTIELGHASDTTLSRSAAGTLAVEGVDVVTTTGTQTISGKTAITATGAVTGSTLVSTVAQGTAPLTVTSSTMVANLNAQYVGTIGASALATLTGTQALTNKDLTGAGNTFPTFNQNTTGSAATLTTARTIGGVSFNGSANIDLPGVNTAGTQNTSGTAAGLSSTLAVANGGTGSTSLVTAATASSVAARDANANLTAKNFINAVDSTVTAAGTTTLTAASAGVQVFTGTTTQTVLMPTGVVWAGQKWTILNQSTGALAIQSSTGAAMFSLPAGNAADVTCLFNTPTTAAHWRGSLWAQTAGVIATTSNSLAAFAQSTTNAIGVGTIELGHASDTTLSRSAAGTLAVEGVNVVMTGGALGTPSSGTLTNCTFPTLNQNTTGTAAIASQLVPSSASQTSNGGSSTLNLSQTVFVVTGTLTHNATLPTTSVTVGMSYTVINNSTQAVTVSSSAGNTIKSLAASTAAVFTALVATPTAAAHWGHSEVSDSTRTAANVTGTVAVANGGTGATTLTANNVLLGNGTASPLAVAPGTTGNVLTSNGTTWTSAAPTGGVSRVTSTVTSAVTLGSAANTEYLAYIASGGSVTLPTAVGNTSLYTLKNTDTTTKTITTVGDDASFASVTTLLSGNGVDASTVFTDSSNNRTWVGSANVRLSTAVKKFGTASIYFGAGGNNANLGSAGFPGMGTSDFTIESWVYTTALAGANGYYIYDTRPFATNGVYTTLWVNSAQKLAFTVSAAERITGTTSLAINTWYHVAVSRSGGVTKLFLNGTQEGSNYTDANNYLTSPPVVGNTGAIVNGVWAGYLDDIRITQGVGRYTANFTAPTAEFPVPQLIDGTYPLTLAPNQAIEIASSGSNWSVVSDAAPLPALTSTPTSATITTLTATSSPIQEFTGTTTHTVRLPSAGIVAGKQYTILNNSTGLLTMQTSTAAQIHVLAPGTESILTALVATPTTAAHWEDSFIATSFAAGKALTVSNSLTLAGTDGTVMTFPGATDTVVTLAAAQTLTNKTLTTPTLTTPVINNTPTGTGVATAATASTLALRDANANLTADNFINAVDTTATAGGITTLTIASGGVQVFTGTAAQSVLLPTTSVTAGMSWTIINNSTGVLTVASSAGNSILTPFTNGSVAPSTALTFTAVAATPTTAAHWKASFLSDADRRIVPRSISTASTATPSINSDTTDFYYLTALAVAITSVTVTGVPTDGQRLTIRIKDNGTARAITWGASFVSSGVAILPTTTVASKTHLVGFMYDSQVAKWVCVASDSAGY